MVIRPNKITHGQSTTISASQFQIRYFYMPLAVWLGNKTTNPHWHNEKQCSTQTKLHTQPEGVYKDRRVHILESICIHLVAAHVNVSTDSEGEASPRPTQALTYYRIPSSDG